MSDTQYIRSSTPGKHWSVYTYKPQGAPGYAYAQEGVYTHEDGDAFSSFTTELFGDRGIRENIVGRFTVKNRNAALLQLFEKMHDAGLLDPESELRVVG